MMNRHPDIMFMAEYIKSILYFATVRQGKSLRSTAEVHYFCTDNDLLYENYYSDFGPLNLGCVYKYCRILNDKIDQFLNKQTIVYYTSVEPRKKTNAAFLLGCYGVLYLSLTPRDALKPLLVQGQYYRPFQDATQGDSDFTISLMDCLQAIRKARALGFFNFQDFNYKEYERLDKIQGGDLNWIIPGKFLAFIGPVELSVSLYHPPEMYIDYFLENDVRIVIRLNKRLYNGNVFNNAGILHYDLFFPDGSCPPRHILFKFLQISEESDSAIAVHCKAGLGRTGSLIGCYLIKHYKMTSHEAIAWMRICRPGSVIGHQQAWLEKLESWLIKIGNIYRKNMYQDTEKLPYHEFGVYSIAEKNAKSQPVLFHKSHSPPPPMRCAKQSVRASDLTSSIRPKHSRLKEDNTYNEDVEEKEMYITSCDLTVSSAGPMKQIKGCVLMSSSDENDDNDLVSETINKTAEKQPDWRVNVKLLNINQKMPRSNEQFALSNASSRQSSGVGDPRNGRPTSRNSMTLYSTIPDYRTSNVSDTISITCPTNVPASTFRTRQASVIKNVGDAKSFLTRSSIYSSEGDKNMTSSIIVTPQMRTQTYLGSSAVTSHITRPSVNSAAKTCSQLQNRRRLGRSPSPQPRMASEQTRATNTPSPTEKFLLKDASKSALRDVLSKLKLTTATCRDGSLGAASLGASREAPAPRRAPSVKSDERPLATQGDMLNSIKFQRRFRDTWTTDKIIDPAKTSIKVVNSKMGNLNKPAQGAIGGNKEKPGVAARGFGNPVRPLSPKGRRIPQPSKFD